jgi:spermidine synthase
VNSTIVFAAGFSSAAIQILLVREYLSVFSGNELVIGVIFGLWLLFVALGSLAGYRMNFLPSQRILNALYILSVLLGIFAIRAVRLFFHPGEMIAPWIIPLIVLITQSDAAFFCGLVYGRISKIRGGERLYLLENSGALAGLVFVSFGILLQWSNGILISATLALFILYAFFSEYPRIKLSIATYIIPLSLIAGFLFLNPISIKWKYSLDIDKIQAGYSGEIAEKKGVSDTLILLNNSLYRAKMTLPSVEQAVHFPIAMHEGKVNRVLVLGNMGQIQEIRKYKNIYIRCLENEPVLSTNGCEYCELEELKKDTLFDVILLGSSMPSTAHSGRYFTEEFFKKIKSLTGEYGVFSFTLPFSENFLSPEEKDLKNLLVGTLERVFKYVMILPGNGYTFVVSETELRWPVKISVTTRYLENYTMIAMDSTRIAAANEFSFNGISNTINRPVSLYFTQKQWLGLFNISFVSAMGFFILIGLIAIALIPKSASAVSIGSTGLITGLYSIIVLIIFQYSYGTLYGQISLLMVALTIGFAAGSLSKRFPFSDLIIGLYAALTILILIKWPFLPIAVFMVSNAGMGFLAAAQFVTRKTDSWSGLYAADCAGGVIGMILGSTILIPYFGISTLAIAMGILKAGSAALNFVKR